MVPMWSSTIVILSNYFDNKYIKILRFFETNRTEGRGEDDRRKKI